MWRAGVPAFKPGGSRTRRLGMGSGGGRQPGEPGGDVPRGYVQPTESGVFDAFNWAPGGSKRGGGERQRVISSGRLLTPRRV